MHRLIIYSALSLLLLGCGRDGESPRRVPRPPAQDDASKEIADHARKFKESDDPQEKELGKMLEDFLAKAPEPTLPLWAADNLGWHTNQFTTYSHTLERKPPFFSGAMPLEYTAGQSAGGVLFFHDFGGFRNQFKLNDALIVIGARTIDGNGRLLAEARARYYVKGIEQGIELEEFHYDKAGAVTFKCKSDVDGGTGFKVDEKEKIGKKDKDYYFLWPTRQ